MSEDSAAYFDKDSLHGGNASYAQAVEQLKEVFDFDFVSLGLTSSYGAPLRWVYAAGANSERHRRIALAPGQGIGGIVIKTGKPMLFEDIDAEIDPREYSSYPIVFTEDLRSFCCLPLRQQGATVAALLLGYRSVAENNAVTFKACVSLLAGRFCNLDVVSEGFLSFDDIAQSHASHDGSGLPDRSVLSRTIQAQESERTRLSRELHDGISQELLVVSFRLRQLEMELADGQEKHLLLEASDGINQVIDELHNLSVDLRPSSLDHFGLVAALRAQAQVYEKNYGVRVCFSGDEVSRFDAAFETQTYRICQEAILNSCKYSGSDKVTVSFFDSAERLQVVVVDGGKGFDTEHPVIKGSGCGLAGMQERADLIGAVLAVESSEDGTTVRLEVPKYNIIHEGESS